MQTPKFKIFDPQMPPLQSATRGRRPPSLPFPPPLNTWGKWENSMHDFATSFFRIHLKE